MSTFIDARLTDLPYGIQSANAVDSMVSYGACSAPLEEPVAEFFHLLLCVDKKYDHTDIEKIDTQNFFVSNLFITNSLKEFYELYCTTPETSSCFKTTYKSCITEGHSGLRMLFACLLKLKLTKEFEDQPVQQFLNDLFDEVHQNDQKTLLTTDVSVLYKHCIVRANQRLLFTSAHVSAKYFIYLTQIFEIILNSFKGMHLYRNYLIDILEGFHIIDDEYITKMQLIVKAS